MPHSLNFHPEWGCLAPAPSLLRTMRIVLVATAVGATAGGGVVLSLVAHSAPQTSVAERTLVGPIPATPISVAPQTTQLIAETLNKREAREFSSDDGHVDSSVTIGSVHPAVIASSAEVRTASEGTKKTAVAPSPAQKRLTHVTQRARQRDNVSSSRQVQHSGGPQTAPSVVDRFLTGLTAAIEHVWPSQRLPADRTSRADAADLSANIS
jgi:hypothetical protein